MTYRPPRVTAIWLGIAAPEGPDGDEWCTCMFTTPPEPCPACKARGFTTNETVEGD